MLPEGILLLLIDFIKAQPDKKHVILLTDIFANGEQEEVINRFHELPVKLIFAPSAAYQEKLLWLHEKWLEISPLKVFLFNHPQDSIVIAAAQPEKPGKLLFYHHSDFTLGLGTNLKHAKHIDMNPLTFAHCRDFLKIKNVYCPLTCSDPLNKNYESRTFMVNGNINTATSTPLEKISVPYLFSYFDLLPDIIQITKGNHLHIGFLPTEALKIIKKKLTAAKIPPNKFIHLPWTNSVSTAIIEHNTDLYITSFPIGGGRTIIEAMASGIPILCHKNYRSVFLSENNYLYPEALLWDKPDALKKILLQLTPSLLTHHSLSARKYYEKYYTQELLVKTIENNFENVLPAKEIKIEKTFPNPTQLFLDFNDELTSQRTDITRLMNLVCLKRKQTTRLMNLVYLKREQITRIVNLDYSRRELLVFIGKILKKILIITLNKFLKYFKK